MELVPVISKDWDGDLKKLSSMISKSKYSSKEVAEGLYIRFKIVFIYLLLFLIVFEKV